MMDNLLRSKIGKVVRGLRLERGLSQIELSNLSGSKQSMISMLERGIRNKYFDLDLLYKISINLGLEGLWCLIKLAEEYKDER